MAVRKILWASDGSKESRHALRWVRLLAGRLGAEVVALSILDSADLETMELAPDLRDEIAGIDAEVERIERKRLARVLRLLSAEGIAAQATIAKGVPVGEIIKAAQDNDADLIAMGKRGMGAWSRFLLGSTTGSVLRQVRQPVLTVSQTAPAAALHKILVPTALAPLDVLPLQWALELARVFSAQVVLLHVIEVPKTYALVTRGFVDRLRDEAGAKLRALIESVPAQTRQGVAIVEKTIDFARAWSGIVRFARDEKTNMIVMTTHARSGVSRAVLGSVAENVTTVAPCPVVTFRPAPETAAADRPGSASP